MIRQSEWFGDGRAESVPGRIGQKRVVGIAAADQEPRVGIRFQDPPRGLHPPGSSFDRQIQNSAIEPFAATDSVHPCLDGLFSVPGGGRRRPMAFEHVAQHSLQDGFVVYDQDPAPGEVDGSCRRGGGRG